MADTKLDVFPIGAGKFIPLDHTGPTSYATGGETIGTSNNLTGISTQGLSVIDFVDGGGSVSGTYFVISYPVGTGSRKTYKLLWFVTATGAQVANAVNLSAETVRLVVVGR
jgi:hypothetical protein